MGQGIAFLGVLIHLNFLSDPYSVPRYFLFSLLCLSYSIVNKPRQGRLTVPSLVYLIFLAGFCLVGFKPICLIGSPLNYFSGLFPMFLVAISYHMSIGERWEKIANSFIVACVIVSILCIGQTKGLFQPQGAYFGTRVYACLGSPVFLAGTMAMAIPLCLGRTYAPFAIPLLVCTIILSQTRSGLVAAGVGVLGYAYAAKLINLKHAAMLACAAVVLSASLFSSRNTFKSDLGRFHMTRVALKSIAEHPLGIGPERFGWAMVHYRDKRLEDDMGRRWSNSYVHNQVLEALVTGGPIFLVVHILLICVIGLFLYRAGNPAVYGAACALCVTAMMQPCPLVLKCVLAALAGSVDPSPDLELPRAPFILAAALAFLASLSCLTAAKIHSDGTRFGLAQIVVDSYKYQESAINDE